MELPQIFGFFAQKKGKGGLFGSGWRKRYFLCDVGERRIAYYEDKPSPGTAITENAKGVIDVMAVTETGSNSLEVLDASGRVFQMQDYAPEDGLKLVASFSSTETARQASASCPLRTRRR